MAEFSLIRKYCMDIGIPHPETRVGIGDDAAVVSVPEGYELAISVDTMVEGTHFFDNTDPELLAHKILAVNLSDMASMGAQPKWATLSTCLSSMDEAFIERFCGKLNTVATNYGVQLIGGDTAEGPTAFSLTIMGLLPKGKGMLRSGAKVGDAVYCTGNLGDAGLAVAAKLGELSISDDFLARVLPSLDTPRPQVALGRYLVNIVNSCIDISDGLVGDAEHIAKSSDVTIEIDIDSIPLSDAYREYLAKGGFLQYAVAGGDDYQLLFTVSPENKHKIDELAKLPETKVTQIGTVVKPGGQHVNLMKDGKPSSLRLKAYQHFS